MVQRMEKGKLLIIPFLLGLTLLIYSWYVSFPLSVSSVGDSIYNHVPIFYWISVPLLLTSMFLMTISFKNIYLRLMLTVGFVIVLYSLLYFYFTIPTVDSAFFRGLTENFIGTNNLDASQFIRSYYQWPSFFLLANVTTLVSGLSLTVYEFLLFTIIGFLLATTLYVYASKAFNRSSGFLAVAAFFVVMFLYLNYQAVPFSLAFGLLFVLFMLETRENSAGKTLTMLILYSSLVITHAFVPLFFVIYLLIRSIITRSRQYFEFFILTLVIYLIAQITFAVFSFRGNIASIFTTPTEYSSVVGASLASSSVAIDTIPQLLSRTVTIGIAILCVAGFVFIVFRRKLRTIDKAIFLTGAVYSGLGVVFNVLGTRAVPIVFVPLVLGATYLFQSKFRKYLKYLVFVLLILVVFVPIHSSITSFPITFQTKDDLATANFMIEKYDWKSNSLVITDLSARWYMLPQIHGNPEIDTDIASRFGLSKITAYDSITYSVGMAKSLNMSGISIENTSSQIIENFNVLYNSGSSYIAVKSR
jgi:hypothetical protein